MDESKLLVRQFPWLPYNQLCNEPDGLTNQTVLLSSIDESETEVKVLYDHRGFSIWGILHQWHCSCPKTQLWWCILLILIWAGRKFGSWEKLRKPTWVSQDNFRPVWHSFFIIFQRSLNFLGQIWRWRNLMQFKKISYKYSHTIRHWSIFVRREIHSNLFFSPHPNNPYSVSTAHGCHHF